MADDVRALLEELLRDGDEPLAPREQRILDHVTSGGAISRDIGREIDEARTLGARVADRVAEVGGSWSFLGLFGLFLAVWVLVNSGLLVARPVDPYPFIFLNLLLSMLAAVQAPVIMMSQNRQAAKDRLLAAHDFEVNLKAELEIMALHAKLDRLRARHLEEILAMQQKQLALLTSLAERPGGVGPPA